MAPSTSESRARSASPSTAATPRTRAASSITFCPDAATRCESPEARNSPRVRSGSAASSPRAMPRSRAASGGGTPLRRTAWARARTPSTSPASPPRLAPVSASASARSWACTPRARCQASDARQRLEAAAYRQHRADALGGPAHAAAGAQQHALAVESHRGHPHAERPRPRRVEEQDPPAHGVPDARRQMGRVDRLQARLCDQRAGDDGARQRQSHRGARAEHRRRERGQRHRQWRARTEEQSGDERRGPRVPGPRAKLAQRRDGTHLPERHGRHAGRRGAVDARTLAPDLFAAHPTAAHGAVAPRAAHSWTLPLNAARRFGPMPGISPRSSIERKPPCCRRYSRILLAVAGPTPSRVSSCSAVAVLRLTGA